MSILRDCPNRTPGRLADEMPQSLHSPAGPRSTESRVVSPRSISPVSGAESTQPLVLMHPDSDESHDDDGGSQTIVDPVGNADTVADDVIDRVAAMSLCEDKNPSSSGATADSAETRDLSADEVAMPTSSAEPSEPDHHGSLRLDMSHAAPHIYSRQLLVFDSHIGRIIGKKGQTVSEIQRRSGARVDIPQTCEAGTEYRRVSIIGTPDEVKFCSVLVRLQLPTQNESDIETLRHEVQDLQTHHYAGLALRVVEVPMEHVGRIIGRKGQYLRMLKEMTGATVMLPRFSLRQGSPHQIFTIMGDVDQVAACEMTLLDKFRECRDTASTTSGFSPPNGDAMGDAMGNATGKNHHHHHSGYNRDSGYNHHHAGVDHTRRNGAGDGARARVATATATATTRKVLYVLVPNEHIGRVIGKGGSAIKELQRSSGASVYLPGEDPQTSFREMQIHGTDEQQNRCYRLLVQKVPYLEQAATRFADAPIDTRDARSSSSWDDTSSMAPMVSVSAAAAAAAAAAASTQLYAQHFSVSDVRGYNELGYPIGMMYGNMQVPMQVPWVAEPDSEWALGGVTYQPGLYPHPGMVDPAMRMYDGSEYEYDWQNGAVYDPTMMMMHGGMVSYNGGLPLDGAAQPLGPYQGFEQGGEWSKNGEV